MAVATARNRYIGTTGPRPWATVPILALLVTACAGTSATPSPQATVTAVETATAVPPTAMASLTPVAASASLAPANAMPSSASIPDALQGTWVFLNQPNPPDPASSPGEYTQYLVLSNDQFAFESYKTPATPPPVVQGGEPPTTGPAMVLGNVLTFLPSANACYGNPNGKGTYRWTLSSPTELRTTLIGDDPCPRAAVLRAGRLRLFSHGTSPLP
jgi:hypothetical protein